MTPKAPGFLSRREFVQLIGAGAAAATLSFWRPLLGQDGGEGEERRRPNIVLIYADDQGYAEMGCQGCKDVPTPHMDLVAGNGVRFTDGYVTAPLCSPSRAGLLTGRYQQRFGHEHNPGSVPPQSHDAGLPLDQVTLADRLKAAGYRTGMVGKWHLGMKKTHHPMNRGFEEFFGFLHGGHSYLDHESSQANPILRGFETAKVEEEYLTDAFSKEAVAFIERHRKEPFFLYFAPNAVHSPLQATDRYMDRFESIEDTRRRTFAAMESALDDAVGAVLEMIRRAGLEEDTLVFYISDNGGPTPKTTSNNAPLRGTKGQVYEGGIRVPFLMQWKGRVEAGRVFSRPVSALDVVPTALAAAGVPVPEDAKLDGVNLLPFLKGEAAADPHETLFWRMGARRAARKGRWKILAMEEEAPFELYDLEADIAEARNLAAEKPEILDELKQAYAGWESRMVDPLWGAKSARKSWWEAAKDGEGEEATPEEQAEDILQRLDRDGDGKLSKREAPKQLKKRFDRLDRDGDGFLSEEEILTVLKRRLAREK